jgi:pyruvate/2-oxoglutarate/acetoin dehydrogenase E1 component
MKNIKSAVEWTNFYIKKFIKKNTLVFGQNIIAGSRLGGLTNEIDKYNPQSFNTQNSELSLVGLGMGALISNNKAIYFAKQLDFLLLSMDHLVNTYNSALSQNSKGSFVIITYIVDTGYEGPQSRLNCLGDFASISKVNCRYLISAKDIKFNIKRALSNKGLSILCLSQKFANLNDQLFNSCNFKSNDNTGSYFRYKSGKSLTIVAYGFSIYQTLEMIHKKKYKNYDLFIITNPINTNIKEIIKSALTSKKVILMDDSDSKNRNLFWLENRLLQLKIKIKKNLNEDNINALFPSKYKFIIKNTF